MRTPLISARLGRRRQPGDSPTATATRQHRSRRPDHPARSLWPQTTRKSLAGSREPPASRMQWAQSVTYTQTRASPGATGRHAGRYPIRTRYVGGRHSAVTSARWAAWPHRPLTRPVRRASAGGDPRSVMGRAPRRRTPSPRSRRGTGGSSPPLESAYRPEPPPAPSSECALARSFKRWARRCACILATPLPHWSASSRCAVFTRSRSASACAFAASTSRAEAVRSWEYNFFMRCASVREAVKLAAAAASSLSNCNSELGSNTRPVVEASFGAAAPFRVATLTPLRLCHRIDRDIFGPSWSDSSAATAPVVMTRHVARAANILGLLIYRDYYSDCDASSRTTWHSARHDFTPWQLFDIQRSGIGCKIGECTPRECQIRSRRSNDSR